MAHLLASCCDIWADLTGIGQTKLELRELGAEHRANPTAPAEPSPSCNRRHRLGRGPSIGSTPSSRPRQGPRVFNVGWGGGWWGWLQSPLRHHLRNPGLPLDANERTGSKRAPWLSRQHLPPGFSDLDPDLDLFFAPPKRNSPGVS